MQNLNKMEKIKKKITDLLWSYATKAHGSGSCGELGDSFMAIDADSFSDIAEELISKLDIKDLFTAEKTDFDKAVEPAIRFLLKHHDPHTKIYINYSTAELLQGRMCHNLNNEIPD